MGFPGVDSIQECTIGATGGTTLGANEMACDKGSCADGPNEMVCDTSTGDCVGTSDYVACPVSCSAYDTYNSPTLDDTCNCDDACASPCPLGGTFNPIVVPIGCAKCCECTC